jgi:hypothetical protein
VRFKVESISISSRGIAARTRGSLALSDPQLDSLDVIIVGGLDRLSTADVRALERFMRERGGAVVLVPDARVDAGPARELMPPQATERLLERPATLSMKGGAAALGASELLLLGSAGVEGEVVAAAADESPVVLSLPRGRGRVFISGAMDAWRYRASGDRGFDRFWQAAAAALALAAPPPIDVRISPPALRPLERGVGSVRLRPGGAAAVAASVDGEIIRLWPEPEAGTYRGTFTARKTPGRMSVEVTAAGDRPDTTVRDVAVEEGIEAPVQAGVPLALLAASHRGIDVTPERLDELARFVRDTITAPDADAVARPLRIILMQA